MPLAAASIKPISKHKDNRMPMWHVSGHGALITMCVFCVMMGLPRYRKAGKEVALLISRLCGTAAPFLLRVLRLLVPATSVDR